MTVESLVAIVKGVKDKGYFHLLSANFITGFLGFGSQLLVAKFLTAIEIGQIRTIQSYLNVAVVIAGCGFNTAVLKLCSEQLTGGRQSYLFRMNLLYSLLPTVVVSIALALTAKLGWLSSDDGINMWMMFFVLTIPAAVYIALFFVYLQAKKEIQSLATVQTILRLSGVALVVVASYFFTMKGFVFATIAASYLGLVPFVRILRTEWVQEAVVEDALQKSWYIARWSLVANIIGNVAAYLDIFFLNALIIDRAELGYYGLATVFILAMNYVTSTAQSIATPYFSEKSNQKQEFFRALWKYQRYMILLSAGVAVAASLLIPPFILIVYGEQYASVGMFVRILSLKYFFWSCYALLGVAVLGLGKIKYNVLATAVTLPIGAILSYLFIKEMSAVGAAIAQAATYFVTLWFVVFVSRKAFREHFGITRLTVE